MSRSAVAAVANRQLSAGWECRVVPIRQRCYKGARQRQSAQGGVGIFISIAERSLADEFLCIGFRASEVEAQRHGMRRRRRKCDVELWDARTIACGSLALRRFVQPRSSLQGPIVPGLSEQQGCPIVPDVTQGKSQQRLAEM